MAARKPKRVAVIGAGFSGITAGKTLLEAGLVPVIFERSRQLGGVWSFDESLADGGGPAYRSLRTNTPKNSTAFSDFPFPPQLPDQPLRADVVQYLADYADHFGIREHIRFETSVASVTPLADGCWKVCSEAPAGELSETFDAVFVGSGMFREPVMPSCLGLETFAGTVLHSRAYADPQPFTDQRVLVVGTGSSGSDIAVEVAQVAREVWVSGRSVNWTAPASSEVAVPPRWRGWLNNAGFARLRARLTRHLIFPWLARLHRQGRLPNVPDAPFELDVGPAVPAKKLAERIAAGAVRPKPAIACIEDRRVVFVDGTHAEVDVIIFATGYAVTYPFLDPALVPVPPDGLGLYRLVFHPDMPNLAFLGMCRATGAIPPLAEMQARWAVAVLLRRARLPAAAGMWREIAARRSLVARRHGNPFRLEFEPYMDLLAAELGIMPRLWRHPRLWRSLLLGPPLAAQYRLEGSGRWKGAAQVLADALPQEPGAGS